MQASTLVFLELSKQLRNGDKYYWFGEDIYKNGKKLEFDEDKTYGKECALRILKALYKMKQKGISPAEKYDIGELSVEPAKTKLFCVVPVLGAINAVQEFVKSNYFENGIGLVPKTEEQRQFVDIFYPHTKDIRYLTLDELITLASTNCDVINNLLKEHGYEIQLEKTTYESISVASILNLNVDWNKQGFEKKINYQDETYKAFNLDGRLWVTEDERIHPYPVFLMQCRNNDWVYITRTDITPQSDVEFVTYIEKLKDVRKSCIRYDSVTIPNVSFNMRQDISWLINLGIGKDMFVTQALQEIRFDLDRDGAKVKSAVAMEVAVCASACGPYVIDGPFMFWVEREGIELPLFAAVLNKDTWVKA